MFFGMNNEIKECEIIETKTALETYDIFCKSRDKKISKQY